MIAAWNAQLEQNRADQEAQERISEKEEARRAQREREADEQLRAWRREVERKKPQIKTFDPNLQVGNWIEARPAPYALNSLEYVTTQGCKEAAADSNRPISHGFARLDDTFAIRPLKTSGATSAYPGKKGPCKNIMLHFMVQSGD